jgi:hypothetical protein
MRWVREKGMKGSKEGLSLGALVLENNIFIIILKLCDKTCFYLKLWGRQHMQLQV